MIAQQTTILRNDRIQRDVSIVRESLALDRELIAHLRVARSAIP
jgi:hypothetical protein